MDFHGSWCGKKEQETYLLINPIHIRFISKSLTRLMKCPTAPYLHVVSKEVFFFLQRAQMQIHDAIARCQSPPPRRQTPYS